MRSVAIYVRVSTTEQAREGYSIDEQIDILKKFAADRNWRVPKIYKDAGFSGAKLDRPAMEQLIRDCQHGFFNTVLVYKLDRLARSTKNALYLIEDVFSANNIDFVSMSENLDLTTPAGRLNFSMFASFAQFERDNIRERMSMGKHGRAKSGKTNAWSRPPFGYDYIDGRLVVNPVTAPIVRDMFAWYLSGSPINQIVERLNTEGHIGKDKPWHHTVVKRLLENKIFAGFTSYKQQFYQGIHEPLVTLADWEKTQNELERRQAEAYSHYNISRPFQSKHLLSGLLYCGYCSTRFTISLGNIRKDGTRNRRYRCHNVLKGDKSCPSFAFSFYRAEELENDVLTQIERFRLYPSELDVLDHDSSTVRDEIEALSAELDSVDKKLARLVDLYVDGSLPMNSLNAKKTALDSERSAYAEKIDRLSASLKSDTGVDEAREILLSLTEDIRRLDLETQKRVVRALIEKIEVKGDEMVIRWRFA